VEDSVTKFGRLDAARQCCDCFIGPFAQTNTQQWRKVMATDLDGVYPGITASSPETKGSIINVSSVSGLGGDWGLSSYNAAMGAITNFTRSFALEYGSRSVRINTVAPSLTSTEAKVDLENSASGNLIHTIGHPNPTSVATRRRDLIGVNQTISYLSFLWMWADTLSTGLVERPRCACI
jgi:NAD(P)-dependent dehydrogenase (short-subunit alcohol dehydrogenase family)